MDSTNQLLSGNLSQSIAYKRELRGYLKGMVLGDFEG